MDPNDELMQKRLDKYTADKNDMYEVIEEPDDLTSWDMVLHRPTHSKFF